MGVQIATTTKIPLTFGAHYGAVFSDGKHIAVWFSGTAYVYALSSDNGATWGAVQTIFTPGSGLTSNAQGHIDFCQNGDTLYGACLDYPSSSFTLQPFKLAYSGGSVTVSTGTAQTYGNYSAGTGNPGGGGCTISASWDSDHTYFHIGGAQGGNGLTLWCFDTSLTLKFSKTGGTGNTYNTPTVYVPSGGATGTLWACYTPGVTTAYVNNISVTSTAYGSWGTQASVWSGGYHDQGAGAFLDTTQTPSQPGFFWTSTNGGWYVATYSGTTWTVTTVISSATNCYGGAMQCVGNDLWAHYIAGQTNIIKRLSGTWQTSGTSVDASGDRAGWTPVNQSSGTLLLVYMNSSGNAVYSQAYTLSSTHALTTQTHAHFVVAMALKSPTRTRYSVRTGLTAQTRTKFFTRVALQAQTRSNFLIAKALKTLARSRFLVRTGLVTTARSRFVTRMALTEQARTKFSIRTALVTATRSIFKIAVANTKALVTGARTTFVIRKVLQTPTRSTYAIRHPQQTAARTSFAIRFSLTEQARTRFYTRISLQTQTRARFLIRMALAATTRTRYILRSALTTTARSKFLIFLTGRSLPFSATHNDALSLLNVTGNAALAMLAVTGDASINVLTVTGGLLVVTPFTSINSPITVKDTSGNPVANLSAVSLTVTYPDGTTASVSLGSGIVNSGNGVYTASYSTKDFGRIQEDWALTAADGVTVAKARFTIPVTYQGV